MSRHYKKHTKKNKFKRNSWATRDLIQLAIGFVPVIFVIVIITRHYIGNILLENYGIKTRAVVTNVVNGTGRFHRACYLYEFMIGGECYTGNSLIDKSEKDRVGDSIDVLYLDFWPSTTRPTSFFE